MKTSVRFLSLLLAILMIAGAALTASADNTDKIANEEALEFLVKLGVFGGYEDGSLKPNELVERDEMAKIIFVLYTTFSEAGAGTVSFKDVPADNWAAGYISWCSTKGIVGGYGNGNFGPDDHITYDQALKMVCGALGYTDWDSNFWPVDVRRMALTTLNLGENISDVNGSDYVTRAQIAQIAYNALYADMKETKVVNDFGFKAPMKLAADIWDITTAEDVVVATETLSSNGADATEEEDEIVLSTYGDATLEELCLENYKGKTDDLIKARVNLISRGDELIATTVKSVYADGVKITLDKENNLCLDGEKLDNDVTVNGLVIDKNGVVTEGTLAVPNEKLDYVSLACDVDADGDYDWIYWNYYEVYEVESIGKNTTIFAPIDTIGTGSALTVDNDMIEAKATYEEEDIVVLVNKGNKAEVVSVIAPATASVTKFGNNKITLEGFGEYVVNETVFTNAAKLNLDKTIMALDADGNKKTFDFYVYGDKVFAAPATTKDVSDYNLAILAYVNTPEEPVLDVEKQEFSEVYTAVLVIDGKETLVSLNADETIIDANGQTIAISEKAEEVLAAYGKNEHIVDGYLQAPYTLVSYSVDDEGKYTLKLKDTENAEYYVLEEGAKITYDKKTGLYEVVGNITSDMVVMSDSSAIYYTYTKKETGAHKYLGVYTSANIYTEFEEAETVGYSYLYKGEDDDFYTIAAMMLKEELVEIDNKATYKTDGRLIKYCYGDSTSEMIVEKNNGIYYTHSIMDMSTLKNEKIFAERSKAEGEKALSGACFYAQDKEGNYILINNDTIADLGVTSVSSGKLKKIYNGIIFTEEGKYATGVRIPESAIIWAPAITSNAQEARIYEYKQVTVDELAATLEYANEYAQEEIDKEVEENKRESKGIRLIFFTYLDEKNNEQIAYVVTEYYTEHTNGMFIPHSPKIHDNFGA